MNKFNVNKEWKFMQSEVGRVNKFNYSSQKRLMLFGFQTLLVVIMDAKNQRAKNAFMSVYTKHKNIYPSLNLLLK